MKKSCSYLLTRQLLRPDGLRGMLSALFSEEDITGDDAPLEKLEHVTRLLKSRPVGVLDEVCERFYSSLDLAHRPAGLLP